MTRIAFHFLTTPIAHGLARSRPRAPIPPAGVAALAAALLVLPLATGCGGKGGPPAEFAVEVAVTKPEVTVVQDTLPAVGTVEPDERVVIQPEVAGLIEEIGFEEGQRVQRGDVLFRMRSLALPLALFGALGALWFLGIINNIALIKSFAPLDQLPGFLRFLTTTLPEIPAMTLNVYSLIGIVLLLGLVTKNSILLVEFANQRLAQGVDATTAMLDAGRIRLRPILMTAFSTTIGILPVALGLGEAAGSRRPLGIAVVGGMLTSTFLTLFIVPVVYILISPRKHRAPAPAPSTTGTAAANAA